MKEVIIESNGTQICAEPVNERVLQGAYNSMNWQRFSDMIAAELKKHHDVLFELDHNFAFIRFEWRKWLYISVETIHFYVMMLVKHCYSHNPFDIPGETLVKFLNR